MSKKYSFSKLYACLLLLAMLDPCHALAQDTGDFTGPTLVQLFNDGTLRAIAIDKGAAAFRQHCAECHGEDGAGNSGVSDLTNGLWLWGGSLSDLETTIRYGIRSGHDLQRFSEMPAYKDYELLNTDQLNDLVEYTLSIAMQEADAEAVKRAAQNFESICSECHDYNGTGRMEYYGAPDLTDYYWQYGDSREAIHDSIVNGRKGVSPAFDGKMDNETIKMLTIYVYSLTHS
jgi:cytochrome c oxidase cbb3-type subunit 3